MSERDHSILFGRGITAARQRYVKLAECTGCGEPTTDFVLYDAGPRAGSPLLGDRITVNLCVKVERGADEWLLHPDEEPQGCAVEYVHFVNDRIARGDHGLQFMHQLLRRFVKLRRPSFVWPDEVLA